jgi:hypothetical protein
VAQEGVLVMVNERGGKPDVVSSITNEGGVAVANYAVNPHPRSEPLLPPPGLEEW